MTHTSARVIFWLGIQYVNQTFDELENVDLQEMQALINKQSKE